MEAARLAEFHPPSHISGHPKVRVLVDPLRDHTKNLLQGSKDMGEGAAERRDSLDSRKSDSPAGVAVSDPEDSLALVVSKHVLEPANILVHDPDVFGVHEDESPFLIEAAGNDILGVLIPQIGVVLNILLLSGPLHEILFVISQLDDQRTLKHILHPLGEHEGQEMSHVHSLPGGPSSSIEVDRFVVFVGSQKLVEVSMREEDPSLQEDVGFVACDLGKSLQKSLIDFGTAKLSDKLIVIDFLAGSVTKIFNCHLKFCSLLSLLGLFLSRDSTFFLGLNTFQLSILLYLRRICIFGLLHAAKLN